MKKRKGIFSLILCYIFWGFQPFYWALISHVNSYTTLAFRILMAAVFAVLILAFTGRLGELKALFRDRKTMRLELPAVLFLLADWAVFLISVNTGHVLDASLGYYINPLVLFAIGLLIFKERCTKVQLLALGIAAVGVIISTVAFQSFPLLSLVIAVNWAVYAALKSRVRVDGVVSIAAETLLLCPFALAFLLFFRMPEISAFHTADYLLLVGSGIVTAMPMFLYSNSITRFSLIAMCFAQYLGPSFNLICGLIQGERFSAGQLSSFSFFIAAIAVFLIGEIRTLKKGPLASDMKD